MPAMIGPGMRLKRAASTNDSNCVLSPSSASATIPSDERKASTWTRARIPKRRANAIEEHRNEEGPAAAAAGPGAGSRLLQHHDDAARRDHIGIAVIGSRGGEARHHGRTVEPRPELRDEVREVVERVRCIA